MVVPDSPSLSMLRNEFVHTLKDLSQYLRVQENLGNCDISLSAETKIAMDKWGTPEWRSHGFSSLGPKSASLMIVDSEGSFFSGPAGALLTKILKAMHLTPSTVFICNTADTGRIINHVRTNCPLCILSLGEKAGRLLLNRKDSIKNFRGQFFSFENIPLMATFHPGALVKDPGLKRLVWDDVQQVMARAGL